MLPAVERFGRPDVSAAAASHNLNTLFENFLLSFRTDFPFAEAMQNLGLTQEVVGNDIVRNSSSLSLSLTLPGEALSSAALYARLCQLAHQLLDAAVRASYDGNYRGALPDGDEFVALAVRLAALGTRYFEAVADLVVSNYYVFGVNTTRSTLGQAVITMPVDEHLPLLRELVAFLATEQHSFRGSPARILHAMARELTSLISTIELTRAIYDVLDSDALLPLAPRVTEVLLQAASTPGFCRRVAIAAEFAGYLKLRTPTTAWRRRYAIWQLRAFTTHSSAAVTPG